ncbi:MAG: PIN domain-containing protein [Halobacteria archaeon]
MKLLDTTFLVDYYRGKRSVEYYLESSENEDLITSTINLKEILVGVELLDGSPEETIQDFGWLQIVNYSLDHAREAAKIESELRKDDVHQNKINTLMGDILIAGAAQNMDAEVVTRNVEDFELLGLETVTY